MFKYVRTMNGSATPPETVSITVGSGQTIYEGGVYITTSSGQVEASLTSGMPKYIALEAKTSSEKTRDVKFLRVLPGMLFETISNCQPEMLCVGMHGTVESDNRGALGYFNEEGNDLEVIMHHYDPNPDLVIVTFI